MKPKLSNERLEHLTGCLPPLALRRFERNRGFPRSTTAAAANDLVRFLVLSRVTGRSLAPSAVIDDLWHEFVLHTREYEAFCRTHLGARIDHVPSETPCHEEYTRTRVLMSESYGELNHVLWPAMDAGDCRAECNSCGSNCSTCKQE